jgi:putative ABC transport system permease protein
MLYFKSLMGALYGGVGQGLFWGLLAIGVFITFRILDFPDMTCEGSFGIGAAVVMRLLSWNVPVVAAMLISLLAGALAGFITGILHTKLKIPGIIAGILVMIAMYSINIHVMGGATRSAPFTTFLYAPVTKLFAAMHMPERYAEVTAQVSVGVLICGGFVALLYWFFGTEVGASLRATGNNEKMCRAQGINTDNTKILALVISNALIAVSGSLVAQYGGAATNSIAQGALVIGLAAIILGEALVPKRASFWLRLVGVVAGAVLYFLIYTVVIVTGLLPATDIKLLSALVVLVALAVPKVINYVKKKRKTAEGKANV